MHSKKRSTRPPAQAETHTAPLLATCAALSSAIEAFVRAHSSIESTLAQNAALDEMDKCADFEQLFELPLRHKLFGMETALLWAFFLSVAPAHAVEEGDAPFSPGEAFDAQKAHSRIAEVYDAGAQRAVWDLFEPEEEDSEGSQDEKEDS